jgi:hypothetical protein
MILESDSRPMIYHCIVWVESVLEGEEILGKPPGTWFLVTTAEFSPFLEVRDVDHATVPNHGTRVVQEFGNEILVLT